VFASTRRLFAGTTCLSAPGFVQICQRYGLLDLWWTEGNLHAVVNTLAELTEVWAGVSAYCNGTVEALQRDLPVDHPIRTVWDLDALIDTRYDSSMTLIYIFTPV
jgi:hypothetical protein